MSLALPTTSASTNNQIEPSPWKTNTQALETNYGRQPELEEHDNITDNESLPNGQRKILSTTNKNQTATEHEDKNITLNQTFVEFTPNTPRNFSDFILEETTNEHQPVNSETQDDKYNDDYLIDFVTSEDEIMLSQVAKRITTESSAKNNQINTKSFYGTTATLEASTSRKRTAPIFTNGHHYGKNQRMETSSINDSFENNSINITVGPTPNKNATSGKLRAELEKKWWSKITNRNDVELTWTFQKLDNGYLCTSGNCNKSFSRKDGLINHYHDPKDKEKPHPRDGLTLQNHTKEIFNLRLKELGW